MKIIINCQVEVKGEGTIASTIANKFCRTERTGNVFGLKLDGSSKK